MNRVLRILNIKPEEQGPALLLGIYYFLITATYVLGTASTSSIFLARVDNGTTFYPLLMTVNTVVAASLVTAFNRLSKVLPLNRLIVGSNLFFAGSFIVLEVFLQVTPWASALMFVMTVSGFTIALFQYYLIASSIFDARQSKRILAQIGVGGAVAGILAGVSVDPFIRLVGTVLGKGGATEAIVIVMAIFILLTAYTASRTGQYIRDRKDASTSTSENKPEVSVWQSLSDPYMVILMVIIGSFILAATTIDIQFNTVAREFYGTNDAGLTTFKGYYSSGVALVQLLLRLAVVGPVLVQYGILIGLLILPIAVIGTTTSYLISPSIWTATSMKAGDQIARYTFNETSTELSWVPVPIEQRLAAKPFISGTFIAIVQGITGLLIFIKNVVGFENVYPLSFVVLGVCVIWIPATFALRRGYLRKLMDSIKQRHFEFEDLNIDTADSAIVQVVDQTLRKGTDTERAFMLDMIEGVRIAPWTEAIRDLYHSTSNIPLRERVVMLSARYPEIISDEELLALIEPRNELTNEAIIAVGARRIDRVMPLLTDGLNDADVEVRAASAQAILRLGGGNEDRAIETLQTMLRGTQEREVQVALSVLPELPLNSMHRVVTPDILRALLKKDGKIRLLSVDTAARMQAPVIQDLVELLGMPTTEGHVQSALTLYPADHVKPLLISNLQSEEISNSLKAGVCRTLKSYPDTQIESILLDVLSTRDRQLYFAAVDSLLHLARQVPLSTVALSQLEGQGLKLAREMYSLYIALHSLRENEPSEILFIELLQNDIREATPTLLKLSVMDVPHTDIESVIGRLLEHDPNTKGNVLEILDNVLSGAERAGIIPLFEDHPIEKLAEIGHHLFDDLDESVTDELVHYLHHGDVWARGVVLDYLKRHPELAVKYNATDQKNITAMNISHQDKGMLSILERTVLMKNSMLFKNIDARDLYHIAQITESVQLSQGEQLFAEGDPGNAMYIVAQGQIRIHQGSHEIVTLQEGDAIGEIALLDGQQRTATATAKTDAQLLKISSEAFFNTVALYTDINQSIMRLLASRLRGLLEAETPH